MKKLLIVLVVLCVLFAAVRIGTSTYENMQREKTAEMNDFSDYKK